MDRNFWRDISDLLWALVLVVITSRLLNFILRKRSGIAKYKELSTVVINKVERTRSKMQFSRNSWKTRPKRRMLIQEITVKRGFAVRLLDKNVNLSSE